MPILISTLHKLIRLSKPKCTSRWSCEWLKCLLESDLISAVFWETVTCGWLDSMVYRKPKVWVGSVSISLSLCSNETYSVPQSQTALLTPVSCLKMIAQNQMIFHREVPEDSISVRKESRIREPIFNVSSSSSFLSTYYGPVTVLPHVRQDNNLEYYFRCFFSDILSLLMPTLGFSSGSVVKNLPAYARDAILIPGLGRSPGKGNGNTLQYTEKPERLQSIGSQKSWR